MHYSLTVSLLTIRNNECASYTACTDDPLASCSLITLTLPAAQSR